MPPSACETELLRNGSKLYYQFNCDSAWLTLEWKNGSKKTIYTMKEDFKEVGHLLYRLGFQLRKENKTTLLFSKDCPANGPCNYVVIDKNTGKVIRKYSAEH